MSDDELDIDIEEDPDKHLLPVMTDKVAPGDYVEHSKWVTLQRLDCERNLWDLVVDGTVVTTFDANKWPTTADLGGYIDGVLHQLEQQDQSDEDGLDARKAGDDPARGPYQ